MDLTFWDDTVQRCKSISFDFCCLSSVLLAFVDSNTGTVYRYGKRVRALVSRRLALLIICFTDAVTLVPVGTSDTKISRHPSLSRAGRVLVCIYIWTLRKKLVTREFWWREFRLQKRTIWIPFKFCRDRTLFHNFNLTCKIEEMDWKTSINLYTPLDILPFF